LWGDVKGAAMPWKILAVLHLILWLIAAFEILSGNKSLGNKILWLLVIFLLPVVGLVLYYLLGRGK
jgi:hypothetical protein